MMQAFATPAARRAVADPLAAARGAGGIGRACHALLLLYRLAGSRRRIALRNLGCAFPKGAAEREALAREHFGWLGRSIVERGLLWWASRERLMKLIHVEGEVDLAERSERPVMWLVPHFMALDVAGASVLLFQKRKGASIYQQQTNPVMDAMIREGRLRLGNAVMFRAAIRLPLIREIRQGTGFFNLPDMDFGARDAAFVPFFGVPAATLLAPSRMAQAAEHDGAAGARRDAARRPGLPRALPAAVDDFPRRRRARRHPRMNRWIEAHPREPGAVPVGAQALQDAAGRRGFALLSGDNRPQ